MLTSLRLRNFKSFSDQTVELSPLTVLLGANASGKSNFLDAIRLLQGIGLDLPLADVLRGRTEGGREIWPGLRGRAEEVARGGAKSFTLESRWALGREELTHEITVRVGSEPLVEHEALRAQGLGVLFDTPAMSLKGWDGFGPGSSPSKRGRSLRAGSDRHPARRSLLGQIEHHRGRGEGVRLNDVVELCHALQQAMRSTLSLDLSPSRMRGYAHRSLDHLGTAGENLSATMHRICQDEGRKAELLGLLSALYAPERVGIEFIETDLGDVLMCILEQDEVRISARSLSDGVLRILGKIAAVLTAPEGSLVLMEELEQGLHPAQVRRLVQILEGATQTSGQVVATTYAPSTLRAMSRDTLGRAVVFGRRAGVPGTVAQRLGTLPEFDVLLAKGVEHLFEAHWPET
ncbi:AAA family ATPase [Chondromyces crocatus]|uniref:ATPase AAA-type core domain-containing protein n=1 Tax=Chondromyces crocatus TaxID=52 RepID=A0A0K1E7M3_CHOCO|nr:ATP-binding protein [Chondromyces crocatus]AKT36864.1 uncharacterized protein CMC5_009850 [Chondromyces crocatus]